MNRVSSRLLALGFAKPDRIKEWNDSIEKTKNKEWKERVEKAKKAEKERIELDILREIRKKNEKKEKLDKELKDRVEKAKKAEKERIELDIVREIRKNIEKKKKLDKELKVRNNLDDDANDKPKRALTKYQQYIRDNQQRIRYEFPKLSNTERFSKLAEEWKDSVEKAENAMSKAQKDRKNEYIDKNEYIETWLQQGKKKIENAKLDKEYAIKNNLFKASPKASAKASPKTSLPKASPINRNEMAGLTMEELFAKLAKSK
jgi:hypothetical protein